VTGVPPRTGNSFRTFWLVSKGRCAQSSGGCDHGEDNAGLETRSIVEKGAIIHSASDGMDDNYRCEEVQSNSPRYWKQENSATPEARSVNALRGTRRSMSLVLYLVIFGSLAVWTSQDAKKRIAAGEAPRDVGGGPISVFVVVLIMPVIGCLFYLYKRSKS